MSIYTSSRAEAHKREREQQKYTVGSSGTSATAQARDARRNAALAEMGVTTTNTAPRTTAAPKAATNNSGYTPTYGSGRLYTSAGNTAGSTVPKTTNVPKTTVAPKTTTAPKTGNTGTPRKTPNGTATIRSGMSDYDIQLRQDYNKKRNGQIAANQAKKDTYLQAMEEQTQADHNKRVQQLADEIDNLTVWSVPITQRATSENAHGSRQHSNYLQTQIDDARTKLRELNGAGIVMHPDEIKARQNENDRLRKQAEEELWSMSDITADDLDDMSREEYLAGAKANLDKTMGLNADVTGAVKNNKAYDRILEYQQRYYADNAAGQFKANRIDARLDQDINLAYSDYMDDPTEQNWEYVKNLSALQNQFQKNNTQTLDEDVVNPGMSLELARNIPGWKDQLIAEATGTAAGVLASGITQGLVNPFVGGAIGKTIAEGNHIYDVTRGEVFRSLISKGVDKTTAAKLAEDEAVINAVIELGGEAVSSGMSKMFSPATTIVGEKVGEWVGPKIGTPLADLVGDLVVDGIVDKGASFIKDVISQANQKRAMDGKADDGAIALLNEAIKEYHFLHGFNESY